MEAQSQGDYGKTFHNSLAMALNILPSIEEGLIWPIIIKLLIELLKVQNSKIPYNDGESQEDRHEQDYDGG